MNLTQIEQEHARLGREIDILKCKMEPMLSNPWHDRCLIAKQHGYEILDGRVVAKKEDLRPGVWAFKLNFDIVRGNEWGIADVLGSSFDRYRKFSLATPDEIPKECQPTGGRFLADPKDLKVGKDYIFVRDWWSDTWKGPDLFMGIKHGFVVQGAGWNQASLAYPWEIPLK